nr:DNA adenine methylase [Rhodohalobacter sp. 614A]
MSPLRYPGGKGKLAPFFHELIQTNKLHDYEYAEVYAGGAGIALDLLTNKFVSAIHLNDLSYPIFSFWYSILNHTDGFCNRIENIPLTVEEWFNQKNILHNTESNEIFDVGFAAFYLNRTNRSGILNGGLIGGKSQSGKWKMDARFNRENLVKRIKLIQLFKSRINLYNLDAKQFLSESINELSDEMLIYLDPPYYEKGNELYENHYHHDDHNDIANIIGTIDNKNWIVSYDNTKPIRKIYQNYDRLMYNLNYSAQKKYLGSEIIILDPDLEYPSVGEIDIIKNPQVVNAKLIF